MSEQPARDWMEIWYETGEITWQKPLSPEARERVLNLYDELIHKQVEDGDDGT